MPSRSNRDMMQRPMGAPAPVAQTQAPVPAAAGQATMGATFAPQAPTMPKPAPTLGGQAAVMPQTAQPRPVMPPAPVPGAQGPGTASPGIASGMQPGVAGALRQ
jgi:hypothetical protein